MEELRKKFEKEFICECGCGALDIPIGAETMWKFINDNFEPKQANPVENRVMPKIAEVVKEILQEGFNVAMYGNPFETEEIIKAEQEKLYDEVVKKYTAIISNFTT